MWGRGLKPLGHHEVIVGVRSPLMWGRGLKHGQVLCRAEQVKSPLMWGRGLKQLNPDRQTIVGGRPSCGGVD